MPKRTPYEDIAFLPYLMAETVCGQPYTGQEFSDQLRPGPRQIEKIEAARLAMTTEQIAEFAEHCDERCRGAYNKRMDWFMKCVRAKDNSGRDQMFVWIAHWLASYLTDPASFCVRHPLVAQEG